MNWNFGEKEKKRKEKRLDWIGLFKAYIISTWKVVVQYHSLSSNYLAFPIKTATKMVKQIKVNINY